jgi:heat shock protein HslJ
MFVARATRSIQQCVLLVVSIGIFGTMTTVFAADPGFPFDKELLLDAKPMKGSKRIPILDIGSRGDTKIDLWCNSVEGRIAVTGNSLTITAGAKTDRQCDAARMRGDDELLEALLQTTNWRREGQTYIFSGAKTLRFRPATN